MSQWTASDIPDQAGKIIIVTGANSGLGFETALALAGRGAEVVMACRNLQRGQDALSRVRTAHPNAQVTLSELDLASLASIRAFAERFLAAHDRLDVLCNNAGIMAIPRRETADGFEMQLGTNHFGHFALTGLLLEALNTTPGARVVNVSSLAHHVGRMRFDDLQNRRFYSKWLVYAQSKLANLLFTHELQRRIDRANKSLLCVTAHPGYSSTNLQFQGTRAWSAAFRVFNQLAQTPAMGALPTLYGATAADVRGGDFFGPDGFMEAMGYPKRVRASRRARDAQTQERLFAVSEDLTGVRYAL